MNTTRGTLIVIGGREDKTDGRRILTEVARRAGRGTLTVATVASEESEQAWEDYRRTFTELGVRRVEHLALDARDDEDEAVRQARLRRAKVVFFTGGDQLRITAKFGGTTLCERVRELYQRGGVIAGTSSGASVMSDTMLVSGTGDESHRVRDGLHMAPGLGLISGVLIDQHFAERGRIGRLIAAVAHNPRLLGLGIDEDTAVVIERDTRFHVLGTGAVYVIDARGVTDSNVADGEAGQIVSVFGLTLHVLREGNRFDLSARVPRAA
jgi:cyanophycinase